MGMVDQERFIEVTPEMSSESVLGLGLRKSISSVCKNHLTRPTAYLGPGGINRHEMQRRRLRHPYLFLDRRQGGQAIQQNARLIGVYSRSIVLL